MSLSAQEVADVLRDGVLHDLLAARQDVMARIGRGGGVGPLLAHADAGVADAVAGLRVSGGSPGPRL